MPRALKRFGQNFLHNTFLQKKIVDSLEIKSGDCILEIGPGLGALCSHILDQKPFCYKAIEIDDRLIPELQSRFPKGMNLIHADFMKIELYNLLIAIKEKNKVIGNIPYNITSPILFKLIDSYEILGRAVLMIQKEVARRITSNHGNKEYGILSVISQTYCETKYLFTVDRGNFSPVPGVDSAVIRLSFLTEVGDIGNHQLFRKIVRQTFNYRRKMLRNSLCRSFDKRIVYSIESIDLSLRPEQLTIQDFKNLSNELQHKAGNGR